MCARFEVWGSVGLMTLRLAQPSAESIGPLSAPSLNSA